MSTTDLNRLNNSLVDYLQKLGRITQPQIEQAFRQVKRYHFLKNFVDPQEAYQDQAIMIKGHISSSSQPSVMSLMLESLELEKGMKVLEIGTASGYNAALLAEVVGQDELVYTMEVERDLAERAAKILQMEGYPGVTVVAGDGRYGYSPAAPYDRIIVTAEANTIYSELIQQLKSDGILLSPINLYDIITVMVKLRQISEHTYRGPIVGFPVTFVPIRGVDVKELHQETANKLYKLTKHIIKKRKDLSPDRLPGLILLMMAWHQQRKLRAGRNLDELFKAWEESERPGINDFDFEYDNLKKEWRLIPIF